MKQGRGRARGNMSRRRTTTPSVICLPQAKPPITPPRKEPEALRAFLLPHSKEPLTRSARAGVKKPAESSSSLAENSTAAPEAAPLPRNRALALPSRGLMVVVGQWLRKLVMKPKTAALTIDKASARTQVRALRVEVAQLQRSLDQLMAQLKQAQ